ncbi:phosphopantothenoylcysteine decarboxylase [Candidatus Altiarchaeota archaeon]
MKRVLITLGPTRESIDDIRFISNASSGRMGLALAAEGLHRGYEATLVSGPIGLPYPENAEIIKVHTAEEMINSTMDALGRNEHTLLISTAAIADYKPKRKNSGKIKSGRTELTIELEPTPKLTATVRKKFPDIAIVGFKAEYEVQTEELVKRAKKKLVDERLDMIIGNDISKNPMGEIENQVYIIKKDGETTCSAKKSKTEIASIIWDEIEKNG